MLPLIRRARFARGMPTGTRAFGTCGMRPILALLPTTSGFRNGEGPTILNGRVHDDECLPTFLSRCMSVFEEAPRSVVLVYPDPSSLTRRADDTEYRASIEAKASRPHRRLARVLSNVVLGTRRIRLSCAQPLSSKLA